MLKIQSQCSYNRYIQFIIIQGSCNRIVELTVWFQFVFILNSIVVIVRSAMLLFIAIFVLLFAYLLFQRRHYYWVSWQLPGPMGLPIIGNGLEIAHPRSEEYFVKIWMFKIRTINNGFGFFFVDWLNFRSFAIFR